MKRCYESEPDGEYRSPVYGVRAVPVEKVVANSYNPNVVAPPEMRLLELSIWEDGYTMPCVCYYDAANDRYELVDGYHRYLVLKTSKRIYERERGLLPVAVIDKDLSDRMASTIRHNRARGTHNIELMSEIVAELTRAQMSDQWIMRHIGMDRDELLRLKQITGLAALFADREVSLGGAGPRHPRRCRRRGGRGDGRSTPPTVTRASQCVTEIFTTGCSRTSSSGWDWYFTRAKSISARSMQRIELS